ncbi:hypothetical protein [Actinomadura rugatobispora]|uniref:Uncharacterized protein n=1 Tax=Actinomadura rugatobispora TaxID=1994 RepID=A0ABW1A2Y7_9ACTN|nr:hypothetical protein GCM10010200_018020 [Actinomadura rugatobispora]
MAERDDYDVHIGGSVSGQLAIGPNNTQISETTIDVPALTNFTEAVAQALPTLGLTEEDGERARRLIEEIAETTRRPRPDHARLRALGLSLRTILESAAGSALIPVLQALWP